MADSASDKVPHSALGAAQSEEDDGNRGRGLFWLGIVMIDIGLLMLLFAGLASFFVDELIGAGIVLMGLAGLFGAYTLWHTRVFLPSLIFALLAIGFGGYLATHTDAGPLKITILICVLLAVEGAFQTALAFDLRPAKGWPWMLVSAVTSIAIAAVVGFGLPTAPRIVLGALLGLSFLTTGIAYTVSAQNIARL